MDPHGFVQLCTETGVKQNIKRKCPPGVDPKVIACLLLKQNAGKRQNDFNRPIRYQDVRY